MKHKDEETVLNVLTEGSIEMEQWCWSEQAFGEAVAAEARRRKDIRARLGPVMIHRHRHEVQCADSEGTCIVLPPSWTGEAGRKQGFQ